ncbi:MAG TPA: hypothetical protein VNA15_07900 [Candidatus Angelobacter sp.]|nr:hypothetical protein [Candidatus Angelobacter sp.]
MLALMLLATTLLLTIDHVALIEQELNSRVLATVGPGIVYANRPPSTCGPTSVVPKGRHGGSPCPLNFVLSLRQKSLVQVQGTNSSVQLLVTLISGVPVPVALSAQGVPAASVILFSPASARPSFSSTMTIATGAETHLGQFNITIFAAGGGLVTSVTLSLVVVPVVHDIAVVSAMVPKTARVGSLVSINATVANYGSTSEVFEIRAYANTSLVAKLSPLRLAASAIYAGRLIWNTTGFLPGTYTVLVAVPPVQGQLNLLDNSREAGQILLTQTPGSGPSPSPAASTGGQGFAYWRQLAILAAIAEVATVFLVVLRSKVKRSAGGTSVGTSRV